MSNENSKSQMDQVHPNRHWFDSVIETVHRLRAPGGCPWDQAQTHLSLRPHLIEEAYETLAVLDQVESTQTLKDQPKIKNELREELGDVLMQVLIHSELTAEAGIFSMKDVALGLQEKLIRRHPHVFGEAKAKDAEEALKNWEQRKAEEKKSQPESKSVLDGLPKALPALQRTTRLIDKVSKVGFQWADLKGPIDKLREEVTEFEKAATENIPEKMTDELGDVLFSICNIAYFLKLSPEDALRGTLNKFERRFRFVEQELALRGRTPTSSSLEEMDQLWNQAKTKGL